MKLSGTLSISALLIFTSFAVSCAVGSPVVQNCSAEKLPCLETIRQLEVCKRLNKFCPLIQDTPSNFTRIIQDHGREYPWKDNQTCSQANSSFCPLSYSCRDSCTLDARVNTNGTTTTPWGENCTSGEGYCPLTASCMPVANECSFRAFYNWKIAGNHTVKPSGTSCPAGQTFCPAKWSCVDNSTLCKVAKINGTDMNSLCPQGGKYGFTQLRCKDNNNTDPFPSFNHTGRSDNGTGYLAACRIHNLICSRLTFAAQRCLPLVPKHCLKQQNATQNHSQLNQQNATQNHSKSCPSGTYLCGARCVGNNETCSGKCHRGHYHCPTEQRCKPAGAPCRHAPIHKSPRVNCTSTQESCATVKSKSNFCKRMRKKCTTLQDSPDNFGRFIGFFEHYSPWGARCEEHSFYCPVLMMCVPRNHTCNKESSIPNEKLPSKSPWGEACPAGKKFCPLVMACIPNSFDCSLKKIANYVLCEPKNASVSGNNSIPAVLCNNTVPFGITCLSNTTFCHMTMSCIPKNDTCSFKFAFNHSIACEDGESFCQKTGRCIPGGHSCGTRAKYNLTQSLNGTERAWAAACEISDVICPRIHYAEEKCRAQLPNNTARKCAKNHCPRGRCKVNAMHVSQCFALDKYCADLTNNGTALQNILKVKKDSPSGNACEGDKRYCPLVLGCIPLNSTCNIYTVNDDHSPITPWGEACRFGQYYCPVFSKCVSADVNCSWSSLIEWMSGDKRKSPYGDENCSGNNTYCIFSRQCQNSSEPCNLAPKSAPWFQPCAYGQRFCPDSMSCIEPHTPCKHVNNSKLNETFGFACGRDRKFCPNSLSCVKNSSSCTNFPTDDASGWATMCQYRAISCQNILSTIKHCSRECPFELEGGCPDGTKLCNHRGECIPKHLVCCKFGSTFCNSTSRCIPHDELCCRRNETFCSKSKSCIAKGQPCLGPEECRSGFFFCRETKKCIRDGTPCSPPQPPQSRIRYKIVESHEELGQVAEGSIFPSGDTIALVNVEKFDLEGKLQLYSTSWVDINETTLSPSTALVLGKTNKLRFHFDNPGDHGVVLVNYTVIAGSAGGRVNASSSARTPDQTLVLLKNPDVPEVMLNLTGVKYEIQEDDTENQGFRFEDLIHEQHPNVSHENHLPSSLFPFIPRAVVSHYYSKLTMVRQVIVGAAIIGVSGAPSKPKEGAWQHKASDGSWKSIKENLSPANPMLPNSTTKYRFRPYLNWNGSISFTVTAFQAVRADSDELGLIYQDLPKSVLKALDKLLDYANASSSVRTLLRKAGEVLAKKKEVPTEAKLLEALDEVVKSSATAQEREDKKQARDNIVAAYKRASAKEGKTPVGSQFRPFEKREAGVNYYYTLTGKPLTFSGRVIAVNDPPIVSSFRAYFSPIAFNLSTNPNNGFLVSDVISKPAVPFGTKIPKYVKPKPLATDVEGDLLGLAVIVAPNSSIGSWYYKPSGAANWTGLDVNNVLTDGKLSGNKSVFLLPYNARVKFEMHDPSVLWSNLEGSKMAKIVFGVWDGTDGNTLGENYFDFPNNSNSISKKFVTGFMSRLGCDRRPGSRGKIDACGRCGGDGLWCRGCDDVPFSGAKIDHCGNCTGGTTNVTFNQRKDCGGGCGTSFRDSCRVCQKYGSQRNFSDCNGDCFGKARINQCGVCTGGSTGKDKNYGKDACGVCSGDGSTCQGCDGIANSGKVFDFCNNCLLPSDPSFNTACLKLSRMFPSSGPIDGGTKISVVGGGFNRVSVAKCKFEPYGGGASVSMTDAKIQTNKGTKRKYFEVTSPVVATAGEQILKCTFDSEAKPYVLNQTFHAYNKSAISFASISPDNSTTNNSPFVAVVTGTGFVNTSYVKCISDDKFEADGSFVSATEIHCHMPSVTKSREFNMVVAFGEQDKQVSKTNSVRFQFSVEPPIPSTAAFAQNLQTLIVRMSAPSKPSVKGSSDCSSFFDSASVTKFGSRSKCVLRTPKVLLVKLRGQPTIGASDYIMFIKGSLIRKFEAVTKNRTGFKNITVTGPPSPVVPKAQLNAPATLGVCSRLRLDASKSSGAGGRKLNFQWSVKWADSVDLASLVGAQTADIESIRAAFSVLPPFSPIIKLNSSFVKLSAKYEFGVTVSNFLGHTSVNSTVIVERQNKALPSLNVGDKIRKIKAAKNTVLAARIKLAPCLDRDSVAANVLYTWEIDAVGVDIGRTDKSRLLIKKGTLRGGKTYSLTVTAAMASDQSLSVTESISLKVESGPLVAVIKDGTYRVVGATETFQLDGTSSRDPDDESNVHATPWYEWECFDSSGVPCFVPDPADSSREKRLVLPTNSKVSIDVAAMLKTKSTYKFVLTFSKDTRKAKAETKVFVEAGSPPKITIRAQKESKEDPTKVVAIVGRVQSTSATTNVSWSCVAEDGYGFIDLSTPGVVLTKVSNVLRKTPGKAKASVGLSLIFKKGALMEGALYKIRLTATHSDSSAYTETVFMTNAPPSQGTLEVSPLNGTALETKFKLSAEVGWSDDSKDLPLKYAFGYYKKKGRILKEQYLNVPGEESALDELILSAGDPDNSNKLTLFVDVSDNQGATTRAEKEITVNPIVINAADLSGFTNSLGDTIKTGDVSAAFGTMGAVLDSLPDESSVSPEVKAALLLFKESSTSDAMDVVEGGGLTDKDTEKQVFATTAKSTKGGNKFGSELKKKISSTFVSRATGASSSRRRRSVSSSPVTASTPNEAESQLTTLANLITVNDYTADGMNQKSQYLTLSNAMGQQMCAGIVTGQPAAVAKTSVSVVSSVKDNFATADSDYIDMACSDCPDNVKTSAKVKFGAELKTQYESWGCTSEETCSGACVVTQQFPVDLFSTSTSNASMTNIVDMKLFNPETSAQISIASLTDPYFLRLPLEYNPNTTVYVANQSRIACKRWSGSTWVTDGCLQTEKPSLVTAGNITYVECQCTKLGILGAFATDEPLPTTPAASTVAPTTAETYQEPAKIQMAFNIDYAATVAEFGKAQVEASIKNKIVSFLGVNESRIINLTISAGSIVVNFVLLPEEGATTNTDLLAKVSLLEQAVKSGNFSVTLAPGKTMTADPNSFKATVGPTTPTPVAPVPTKSSGLTETEIIIISVVCGGVALIVLIVIVVCCCKKKSRSAKINPRNSRQHLTDGSDVEMAERGRENDGYDNNNPNKMGSSARA